jgi:two-component sensor histidine kinase
MLKLFNKALERYETANIETKMKARLFFILSLVMLIILPIAISYTTYLRLMYPVSEYKVNLDILIPEITAFCIFFVIVILLVRGYFTASANMTIILFLISTWTVMIMDTATGVPRLDTIVFIFGVMSITPLALMRNGLLILFYGGINISCLIAFVFIFRDQFKITNEAVIDYIADNATMLLFVSIVAFGQFIINRRALETAQKELEERKQSEEQLRRSLNEKEILLKELHHRVKNNMQVVSSLISLQSQKIDDPKYLAYFMETQNRIHAMALIHEMLYNSKDMSKIDFSSYLGDFTQYLLSIYNTNQQQIHMHINVKDVYLGIDTAVPCGMIINELVSNALKHAFPGGREGSVTVDFAANANGKRVLTVSDDGVGIPKGFNLDNSDSLGMLIVHSLTKQLDGSIAIDGSRGMVVRIIF